MAEQTDKGPSQEGRWQLVPTVMQPWLGDGDHLEETSLPLQPGTPLAMGETHPVALLTLEEELPALGTTQEPGAHLHTIHRY